MPEDEANLVAHSFLNLFHDHIRGGAIGTFEIAELDQGYPSVGATLYVITTTDWRS
jgi:hypothetical protein